jgi:hypothetical protein
LGALASGFLLVPPGTISLKLRKGRGMMLTELGQGLAGYMYISRGMYLVKETQAAASSQHVMPVIRGL